MKQVVAHIRASEEQIEGDPETYYEELAKEAVRGLDLTKVGHSSKPNELILWIQTESPRTLGEGLIKWLRDQGLLDEATVTINDDDRILKRLWPARG